LDGSAELDRLGQRIGARADLRLRPGRPVNELQEPDLLHAPILRARGAASPARAAASADPYRQWARSEAASVVEGSVEWRSIPRRSRRGRATDPAPPSMEEVMQYLVAIYHPDDYDPST